MKRNILYILILLAVVITACEDRYIPNIETIPDALVVEGMLTDQFDYVKVKLSHSTSFNNSSYFGSERKAIVSIESENGNSYPTTEISNGIYQTNEPVPTVVGEGYFLKIKTAKGVEYRSDTEKMMAPCQIDSICLTDSVFRDLSYDYWGEPVVKDYKGISIGVLPKEPQNVNAGFLYKWNALVNYYVYSSAGAAGFNYFCWKEMESKSIYVYDFFKDESITELPMDDLHVLSYYSISPHPIDSTRFMPTVSQVSTSSMYYHLKQYAITKQGAKYWKSVKNQSEASGKLFDPVEEQIIGNIHCISDSSKIAFGYFNVASYTDKVIAVQLTLDRIGEIRVVSAIPKAPSMEDCLLNSIPDFYF